MLILGLVVVTLSEFNIFGGERTPNRVRYLNGFLGDARSFHTVGHVCFKVVSLWEVKRTYLVEFSIAGDLTLAYYFTLCGQREV